MRLVEAWDEKRGTVVVNRVRVADSFWQRLRGLMFKKTLARDEGLLIDPCYSVHTMFMRIPIDVVFLDESDKIIKIARLAPYRTSICRGARRVLEVNAGAASGRLDAGDVVRFVPRD